VAIGGFGYLPRQDGISGGMVDHCRFAVSADGETWETVAEARFDNVEASPHAQEVGLAAPVHGRYVRFTSLSAMRGHPGAGAASLSVYPWTGAG
jgi:alpha-L-fucosidase